eukprot:scaffold2720_cov173-Amphora_coffeaeformis.AAC.17
MMLCKVHDAAAEQDEDDESRKKKKEGSDVKAAFKLIIIPSLTSLMTVKTTCFRERGICVGSGWQTCPTNLNAYGSLT